MNGIYRSIWNEKTGTFVAVSETTKSAGKKTSSHKNSTPTGTNFTLKALAIQLMLTLGGPAYALPIGGVVAAGAASIGSSAGSMTITQTTPNAAINWQSFNIGQTEAVRFMQPTSSSVTLNRVLGADPSSILGSLSANGKVFLVNPNGILFGQGAAVNVGGLLASTLNIIDSDFMTGNYRFSGAGEGTILNQGSINADGGHIALLGANVSNDGIVTARLGSVTLAAGSAITLDVAGDGLLNVKVNQGVVNALVRNGGLIQADGGQVLLTTQAAGSLLQGAVNNTGVIQAQTIANRNGTISLLGDMQDGSVNVGGRIDASAPHGGNGGFIDTSAAQVRIAADTEVTTAAAHGLTGTWLIDPFDFTIGAGGNIEGPALSASLVINNVTISSDNGTTGTNGDVNVNAAITWTAATTLTLNAVRNVNINQAITATNGSLVANAGMDANINAAITTTNGNFTVCCGRDINVNAAVTTTDGNASLIAGRDIVIAAPMTMTRGNVLLRAGPDDTGLGGTLGGTVFFAPGILYTVTAPGAAITVDYTPDSYAVPNDYSGNFTGTASASLTQHMLVFPTGNDKVYDGNTTATLTFKGDPTLGGAVSLVPGTATFDSKNVASNIGITYTGYSLGGADAARFALWAACGAVAGSGRTSADITPAPLTIKANDASKVYGQTFTPASSAFTTPVPPVAGETVTSVAETSTGSPATASVAGSTYPIVITPGSATGANGFIASNYTITYVPGALTVTPLALVGNITAADKVYDATTAADITGRTLTGVVGADVVSYTGGTASFDTPDAGVGKTVTGIGLGLSGADAGNYTVNPTATTTAIITAIAPPIVVPPIVVPPIVVPPIVVPPIVVPPIVAPPIVAPPIVAPPIVAPPGEAVPPYEPPIVPPALVPPTVLPPPATSPPPIAPPPNNVPPPVAPPPDEVPPPAVVPPVVAPPVVVPPVVPPQRVPKQDRN